MKGATRPQLLRYLTIIGSLGMLALASCANAPTRPIGDAYYRSAPAPDWNGMSLSWSKLERIQSWLDGSGPERWPDALPGAELELALGRLTLASKESGSLPNSIIAARLDRAELGFRRVLEHEGSSDLQRQSASDGLSRVEGQRSGSSAASVSTGILPRSSWGAKTASSATLSANRQAWKRITIHHTAMDVESSDLESSTLAIHKIQKEHMARPVASGSDQTWGDIGYHFLIDPSGRVFQGRSMNWKGAHAGNSSANVANIGICLLGNFERKMPSARAMDALQHLIGDLSRRHGIGGGKIYGHQDFKATDCPGSQLMAWVRSYAGQH